MSRTEHSAGITVYHDVEWSKLHFSRAAYSLREGHWVQQAGGDRSNTYYSQPGQLSARGVGGLKGRGSNSSSWLSCIKRIIWWHRLEPYLGWLKLCPLGPPATPTMDRIVGITLHCFILSLLVLSVALVKTTLDTLKFVGYVTLTWAIYKGKITPIADDTTEPITFDQLRDATIFDTSGLKVILIQSRPYRNSSSKSSPLVNRPLDLESASDSSQDISHIFSNSSA